MGKKVIITQSNYIPWKGYFDSIKLVDEVILYDDVQYTKRDWRNRNKIKTPNGLKWLSIPVSVKGKFFQSIADTKISDANWQKKHWGALESNYSKAAFFKDYKDAIEELYLNFNSEYLSEINYHFLKGINNLLDIDTNMRFSSEFNLIEGKTERLIELCKQVNAKDYYTGPSAKNYIDENLFNQENINVHYLDFSNYKPYEQLYPPFSHYVTILDLIFNTGKDSKSYLKF